MPNIRQTYLKVFYVAVGVVLHCSFLMAHPGHAVTPLVPLPTWRLADGNVVSAYLMKSQDEMVWLVDGSNQLMVIPMSDLDESGQQVVRRTASRLRIVNGAGADKRRTVDAMVAMALTGLLLDDAPPGATPEAARAFRPFERVKTRWDDKYLYVESDGLPDHPMMKGIRAWQQQVPLPQPYTGENAWRIPLNPVAAKTPTMIKGRFLRGAIALAANGVPIFNPQNNRGEISQEIGELDEWGGHCGRADDYHYHVVPLLLQKAVGKGMPLAYALDGYPIYGETEPDGSPVGALDECHGHTTAIGYHYHASTKYPYVIAGFHGEVVERQGQVDPQPRAYPIREALPPLRGATITDFKSTGKDKNELTYEIAGRKGIVRYERNADGSYTFGYEDPQGEKQEQTYRRRGGNGAPPRNEDRPPQAKDDRPPAASPDAGKLIAMTGAEPKKDSSFTLHSPEVTDGGPLPREFTGDGASATLPLEWSGAPAGTKSYALIMHHIPGPGDVKWYWVLYDIPADVHSLPKNAKGVGTLGNNSVNRRREYAPPHSKGPGAKTYILTVYALSDAPRLAIPPEQVDRATLLAAIKDLTLASAELKVTYDRTAIIQAAGGAGEPGPAPAAAEGPIKDPPDGGPGGGGAFHLLPREVEDKLKLTPEQHGLLEKLERDTLQKLHKILTADQIKALEESRPPRRPPDDAGAPVR
jgi:phosphatidylethanolamine-binding protein (PEBP) family uncharacterized protein